MKTIKKIILSIITLLFLSTTLIISGSHNSNALEPGEEDNTCIPLYGTDRILLSLSTIGTSLLFGKDFKMVDPDGAETPESCAIPVPRGGKLKYTYQATFFGLFPIAGKVRGQLGPNDPPTGITTTAFPLRVVEIGDKMCFQVQAWGVWYKWGCKMMQTPPPGKVDTSNVCYIHKASCVERSVNGSKSFLPITAPIVVCVVETVKSFFLGSDSCSSLLSIFQKNATKIVKVMLMLYVMFFAIKVMLGKEPPQKSEIFLFVLKMSCVSFFSVGVTYGGVHYQGVTFVYEFFMNAAQDLSQITLRAGLTANTGDAATSLCLFDSNSYSSDVKNLQIWDALDCRIAYYTGLNSIAVGGTSLITGLLALLGLLVNPALLIFAVGMLLFILLFATIVFYVVQVYLISAIIITIVAFLSPIFVPMVLFSYTKKMFDGWLSLLVANVIQPMIMMMYLGFVFAIMDKIMFPECKFRIDTGNTAAMQSFLSKIGINSSPSYVLWGMDLSPGAQSETCRNSFGSLMQQFGTAQYQNVDTWAAIGNFFFAMLQVIIFMFLFYFLTTLIASLAADLSGGPSGASEMSTGMSSFDKSVDLASKGVRKIGAMKQDKAEDKDKDSTKRSS